MSTKGSKPYLEMPAWPYDWQTAENRLDPRIIQHQGEFLLYRALNTRRVIGFLGSGVSAAYGRVTWTELALFHIDKILQHFSNDFDRTNDPRGIIIQQLRALKESKCAQGTVVLAMQLCEQIWSLTSIFDPKTEHQLSQLAVLFELDDQYNKWKSDVPQPEFGKKLFRHWVKRETHDEIPHIARVLCGTPIGAGKNTPREFHNVLQGQKRRTGDMAASDNNFLKLLDKLGERPELDRASVEKPKRAYAPLFTPKAAGKIREALSKSLLQLFPSDDKSPAKKHHSQILLESAEKLLKTLEQSKTTVSPIRYFALGSAFDEIRAALSFGEKGNETAVRFLGSLCADALSECTDMFSREPRRHEVIDRRDDPLNRLVYDLKISRFATTNYDLEIERFFFDIGFSPADFQVEDEAAYADSVRVGAIGARSRDIVLTKDTTVDLLDFATDDARFSLEVVHLHGRATVDSDLLITERDYQMTYLRDSASQHAFRQGLDITFGGNPVLFIGQGLSEEDVVRPLREFVSAPHHRNRAIVVLRDATDDKLKRDAFTMKQFAKLGAHIVHFGFLTDKDGDLLSSQTKLSDESWLHRLLAAVDDLMFATSAFVKIVWSNDVKTDRTSNADFVSAQNRLCSCAAQDSFRNLIGEETLSELISDGGKLDIEFEVGTLESICDTTTTLASSLQDELTRSAEACAFLRDVVPVVLDRVKASLLTLALDAKLDAIHNGWLAWWSEWQETPGDRARYMRYSRVVPDEEVGLWGRHITQTPGSTIRPADYRSPNWLPITPTGRRCMIITAPKGSGKGMLFSFLANTLSVSKERGDLSRYLGQLFHSFSFATEIASVWDAIAVFLAAPKEFPSLSDRAAFQNATGIAADYFEQMSRMERLDWSLSLLTQKSTDRIRNRALIAFNAADILFDKTGGPKHPEIDGVLESLLGPKHKDAPLDIIFSVRDARFPKRYTIGQTTPLKLLYPGDASEKTTAQLESMQHVIRIARQANVNLLGSSGQLISTSNFEEFSDRALHCPEENFLYVLPKPVSAHFVAAFAQDGKLVADEETKLLAFCISNEYESYTDVPDSKALEITSTFLRDRIGSSSYAYNLVRAIARTLLATKHSCAPASRMPQFVQFLRSLQLDGEHYKAASPGDSFYEAILDFWYHFESAVPNTPEEDPNVQESIIRHIAVIAGPVEVEVLAECPLILEHIQRAYRSGSSESENVSEPRITKPQVIKTIDAAIKTLVERDLVLKVEKHDHKRGQDRYQVHRSIQRHVYRKLGS